MVNPNRIVAMDRWALLPLRIRTLQQIRAIAAKKHGGDGAISSKLPSTRSRRQLLRVDDRMFLIAFTKAVFRSGFSWKVIESKWPGFEAAFQNFDLDWCITLTTSQIEKLATDTRIVRHRQKIASVRDNARYIFSRSADHGSFAKFVADWPTEDHFSLFDDMKKNGSRLGGTTGPYALRELGFGCFLMTNDVIKRLAIEGVIDKAPSSKKAKAAVENAFTAWREESGLDNAAISRVLALSV